MPKWLAEDVQEAAKLLLGGKLKEAKDYLEGIVEQLKEKADNMQEKFPGKADAYESKADEVQEFVDRVSELLAPEVETVASPKKEIVMVGGKFVRKTKQIGLNPAWASNFAHWGVNFPLVDKEDVQNYLKNHPSEVFKVQDEDGIPYLWLGKENSSWHGWQIPKTVTDALNDFEFQAKCINSDYEWMVKRFAAEAKKKEVAVADTPKSIADDLEGFDDSIDV